MSEEVNYIARPYGFEYIAYAFEGKLKQDKYQGAFLEDKKITKAELNFNNSLHDELKELSTQLNSVNDLESVTSYLEEFLNRWWLHGEQNSHNMSYYDYLLQ